MRRAVKPGRNTDDEIDLSKVHAKRLRDQLKPFAQSSAASVAEAAAAEPLGPRDRERLRAIRERAEKAGVKVAERGRISAEIDEAYNTAFDPNPT